MKLVRPAVGVVAGVAAMRKVLGDVVRSSGEIGLMAGPALPGAAARNLRMVKRHRGPARCLVATVATVGEGKRHVVRRPLMVGGVTGVALTGPAPGKLSVIKCVQ